MSAEADLLAQKARALAQSHPLTPLAKRYSDRAAASEQKNQPLTVVADWASAAFSAGYCLRRVEENEAGLALTARDSTGPDLDELDRQSQVVAAELRGAARSPDAPPLFLVDEELVIAALDRIISSELSRRQDNVRDGVDDEAWTEFEDYLAWWVIKGYSVRAAELVTEALA